MLPGTSWISTPFGTRSSPHLGSSGASVKTAQTLARHSTPTPTIGRYAGVVADDMQKAVESLPATLGSGPAGGHIKELLAHHLPTIRDACGHALTLTDATPIDHPEAFERTGLGSQPLDVMGSDAACRDLTLTDADYRRWDLNPHRGYPLEDFKSSASAIPPRRRGTVGPSVRRR